jgi:hypothetical protein
MVMPWPVNHACARRQELVAVSVVSSASLGWSSMAVRRIGSAVARSGWASRATLARWKMAWQVDAGRPRCLPMLTGLSRLLRRSCRDRLRRAARAAGAVTMLATPSAR